jgi:hypothetical protein
MTGPERELYGMADLESLIKAINSINSWNLYDSAAFLCLVFIGTLFTRRHGFFAILIPVGYILPTLVVGIPWGLENTLNPEITIIVISLAVLAYRLFLSLVAPIWMSRTSSQAGKERAVLISIAIALGIHATMQFYQLLLYPELRLTPRWLFSVTLDEMKLISAIILGVVMYQTGSPAIDSPGALPTKSQELFAEKA